MINRSKLLGLAFAALLGISAIYLGLFYKNGPAWYVVSLTGIRAVSPGAVNNLDVLAQTIFAGDPGAAGFRFINWAQQEQDKIDQFRARGAAGFLTLLGIMVAVLSTRGRAVKYAASHLSRGSRRRIMLLVSALGVIGLAFGGLILLQPSLVEAVNACAVHESGSVSLGDIKSGCEIVLRYDNAPKDLVGIARARVAWVNGFR